MKRHFPLSLLFLFCFLMPAVAAEPDYFTVTNTHASQKLTVQLKRGSYAPTNVTLNYRVIDANNNVGEWQTLTTVNTTSTYTLGDISAGSRMQFYGNNSTSGFAQSTMKYWTMYFSGTGNAVLSGELMSVFSGTETSIDLSAQLPSYAFYYFFYNVNAKNTRIISSKDLKLSATHLGQYCYGYMFAYCSNMTDTPQLPATTLAAYCYQYMFRNCTSLTQTPQLASMTLATYCYQGMFSGCTSLKTALNLPATTLTEGCYQSMFNGCTALEEVQEELPGLNLPKNCYYELFSGCTSLKTAPEIMAGEDAEVGQSACYNMFTDCSALTKAPSVLRPRTLNVNQVYYNMFLNCTSLQRGPDVWATTIKSGSTALFGLYQRASSLTHIRVHFKAWGSMSFCNQWSVNLPQKGAFYCPPELERNFTNSSWNHIPYSPDYPWTVFSYNLTYIPIGGEWPMGGIEPQLYTWQTDTNYVQGWMRYLDTYGAAYYHDEACTQSFPEEEIIAFLATQQESTSDITKNIYVKLGEVEIPQTERYEFVSYPLKDEDKYEFDCTPASPDPETPEENTCDHEWVQLWTGGPKWATVNLGASTPEEAGDYFMWAGTTANPSSCSWASCPYIGSNQNTAPYSKYGYAQDGLIELQVDDDAARQAWGCGWRIPTREEMTELITRCTVTYNQSKHGYTFTSKEDTSRSIFMPTAGYKNGGTVFNVGKYARYLTATSTTTPSTDTKDRDCYILYWYVNSNYQEDHKPETSTMSVRYWGMSIRPVCD